MMNPDPQEITRLLPTAGSNIGDMALAIRRLPPDVFRVLASYPPPPVSAPARAAEMLRQVASPGDPEWEPPTGQQTTRRGVPLGEGATLRILPSDQRAGTRLHPAWRPRHDARLPAREDCRRAEAEARFRRLSTPLAFHFASWLVGQAVEALEQLGVWVDHLPGEAAKTYADTYHAVLARIRHLLRAVTEQVASAPSWSEARRRIDWYRRDFEAWGRLVAVLDQTSNPLLHIILEFMQETMEFHRQIVSRQDNTDPAASDGLGGVVINASFVVAWVRSPQLDEMLEDSQNAPINESDSLRRARMERYYAEGQITEYLDRVVCSWGDQVAQMFPFIGGEHVEAETLPDF